MATPILQVEGLTKSVGDRLLFGDVTFGVEEGDRIGIVARNGTGKSTLLEIIAGRQSADSGTVIPRRDLRVAMLHQTPEIDTSLSALDACLALTDAEVKRHDPAIDDTARRMLTQLGIEDTAATTATFSGGQRKRVALAATLLSDPQLLILDEPTNHLDIAVIEWLEKFLSRKRLTLLMVTHDRYFLDRVCSRILELDHRQAFMHRGNYAYYLRRRAERIEAMGAELDRVRNTLRREQEWMSRQPQARAGKAKFRIDAFYDLRERSHVDLSERDVRLDVKADYIGSKIFEAEHISKRFGDKIILDDFTYTFARHEKVGIIGANGVGKSTFVKMLQGIVAQDSGEWNVGETVRFGYYSQEGIDFDPSMKVIDAVRRIAEEAPAGDGTMSLSPMQFLTRFLFTPADQQKYISTLSGGERARLHLATVLMRRPNFLILDEPTNDLDIMTLGILEEYLREFKGCVIVISHDRFFLDTIVDHIFVLEGNGVVKDFPGTYTEYHEWAAERDRREREARAPQEQATDRKKPRQPDTRPPRLTFKERRELEELTTEIDTLSAEKAAIEAAFAAGDTTDIAERSRRYEELKNILDEKEMRWLELSDRAD